MSNIEEEQGALLIPEVYKRKLPKLRDAILEAYENEINKRIEALLE